MLTAWGRSHLQVDGRVGEGDSLRGGKGNEGEGGRTAERKMGFRSSRIEQFSAEVVAEVDAQGKVRFVG